MGLVEQPESASRAIASPMHPNVFRVLLKTILVSPVECYTNKTRPWLGQGRVRLGDAEVLNGGFGRQSRGGEEADQLRIPTPRFNNHSASAVSATTKPIISA